MRKERILFQHILCFNFLVLFAWLSRSRASSWLFGKEKEKKLQCKTLFELPIDMLFWQPLRKDNSQSLKSLQEGQPVACWRFFPAHVQLKNKRRKNTLSHTRTVKMNIVAFAAAVERSRVILSLPNNGFSFLYFAEEKEHTESAQTAWIAKIFIN